MTTVYREAVCVCVCVLQPRSSVDSLGAPEFAYDSDVITGHSGAAPT